MTIEELNALYEAADFGNQGNYIAPTTSNIDLTAPVVEGITSIAPVPPAIIPNGGNGKDPDPGPNPLDYGNLDIKGYNQMNISGPVKNSFTDIIGDLYSAYTNISPVHLGIKGVKKIGDFVKEIQKNREIKKAQEEAAAADAERAAMNAAYASQSQAAIDRQNAVTGGRYDGAGSSAAYDKDPTSYSGSSAQGGIQGYGGKSGTPVSQQRRPYGTGGIVTL